jgi:TolA-binding protein
MQYKRLLLTNIIVLISLVAAAQQTLIYSDPFSDYKKAFELYQQQKYGAAKELFISIADNLKTNTDKDFSNTRELAQYYTGLCSVALQQPDAEKEFQDIIANNIEDPTVRLCYFQLGKMYYNQKKYSLSAEWLAKVDIHDLDAGQQSDYYFYLGYDYFVRQRFDRAGPLFQRIKDSQTDYYYPANYYYGYIAFSQKNYTDALKSFEIVKQSKLFSAAVPYYISSIYYMQGRYDDCINYAVPELSEQNLVYRNELKQVIGKCYFSEGKYDKALPYLQDYMKTVTKATKEDIYQVAYCEYKSEEYKAAITDFQQVTSFNDSLAQNANYLTGICYIKTNDNSAGRNAFMNAMNLNFDPFIKENASFNYAKLSYALGYQDVAVKALKNFITQYPKSINVEDVKEYLIDLFLNTNNYEEALAILKTIDIDNPQLKKAHQKIAYDYAIQLYNDGKTDDACNKFDESLNYPVNSLLVTQAYYWKGQIDYQRKNYDTAESDLSKFLELAKNETDLPDISSTATANYTIGYSFLKQNDYGNALTYFSDSKNELKAGRSYTITSEVFKILPDEEVRIGDCSFQLKNYADALDNYNEVITSKYASADYALYQKAIILGLQNDDDAKLTMLQRIITDYPHSRYVDDALFEEGNTYLDKPDYVSADNAFNEVISKYPKGPYFKRAYLKLGLIAYNQKQVDTAKKDYEYVVMAYPKSSEAKDALAALKGIFIAAGDANGYIAFVEQVPNASITSSAQDSVIYLAAEAKFTGGDCDGSIKDFSSYLDQFPQGSFILPAHFYRGECLWKNKDYTNAITDYEYVLSQPSNRFTEKATLQAARIYFYQQKEYEKAYNAYQSLSQISSYKENTYEAEQGIMRSAYKMMNCAGTKDAAAKVISNEQATTDDITEAHYYIAKCAMDNLDYTIAFNEFSAVAKSNKTIIGAEAMYNLADIYYLQKNYKASSDKCFEVINLLPSYDYWIAKSYILLADDYAAQNNTFQAKATLQSIIDNYPGQDLVNEAKQKLAGLQAQDELNSRVLPDSLKNKMPIDSTTINNNVAPQDTIKKQ